jgi:hypothetical protein
MGSIAVYEEKDCALATSRYGSPFKITDAGCASQTEYRTGFLSVTIVETTF